MPGFDAYSLLQYLRHNATGALAYDAVDVTAYVPLINLPADALNVIPWTGVTNDPTGALPQTFWQKCGAAATLLVNALITAGQLIYGGLVAIAGFFFALGEAIVEWGMKVIGSFGKVLKEIQAHVERCAQVLGSAISWGLEFIISRLNDAVDVFLGPILEMLDRWAAEIDLYILCVHSTNT